jgi:hypothetical protein
VNNDDREKYRRRNDREVWEAREDIRAASKVGRSAAWRLGVVIAIVLGLGALTGIGVWVFKVATSDVKGAGDAQIEVNSAGNRLRAQTLYTKLYEGIEASDKKINNMAKNARSEFDRTNIEGAINVCLESVAEYNRLETDVLTSKYRPAQYPARIGNDPLTDCQPEIQPTPSAATR